MNKSLPTYPPHMHPSSDVHHPCVPQEAHPINHAAPISLTSLGLTDLKHLVASLGLPSFRTRQIVQWIYQKSAQSFDEMTNLSKDLRSDLTQRFTLERCTIAHTQQSSDGSRKYLIACPQSTFVETVAMPADDGRLTICISTQAGCAIKCAFCATGQHGLKRNLTPGEMVDQVLLAQKDMNMRVSNVVFMGQGEPFANYRSVVNALEILNDHDGPSIGARKLTVSTSGIVPKIEEFAQLPQQYGLAISLHSAVQTTRDVLMPGVTQFPLSHLHQAMKHYYQVSGRRPTIEYALINGINTSKQEIDALIDFNRDIRAFINLINLNEVDGSDFRPVSSKRALQIQQQLTDAGYEAIIRHSRGQDIDAACGQLTQKLASSNLQGSSKL